MSKYSIGQMNQLGNALEKEDFSSEDITRLITTSKLKAIKKILDDELIVRKPVFKWREEHDVIYLEVTSNGLTGEEWIKRFEKKSLYVGRYAKSILRSNDFKPTNGITYEIAILKGVLFKNKDRVTRKIRAEADKRNLTKPNAEVACLIGENLSGEELEKMGLHWIVVMHDLIKDYVGDPALLGVNRDNGGHDLSAYYDSPDNKWAHEYGFAFVVSQSNA